MFSLAFGLRVNGATNGSTSFVDVVINLLRVSVSVPEPSQARRDHTVTTAHTSHRFVSLDYLSKTRQPLPSNVDTIASIEHADRFVVKNAVNKCTIRYRFSPLHVWRQFLLVFRSTAAAGIALVSQSG